MNLPTISVIIPTFNRADLLVHAIESVLQQSYPNIELWVVDDGSTDHTDVIIEPLLNDIHFIKTSNKGVSHARNIGIKSSSSDWVAFLDSDDAWHPDKILKQWKQLCSDKHLISHTEELWIRNGVPTPVLKKYQKSSGDLFERALQYCCISPSSILIHRSVFEKTGLFDEDLPACEDYDLWLRITAHYPVSLVNEPLTIKNGGHSDQLSQKHWGMDRFRIHALNKILNTVQLSKQQRKAMIEVLQNKSKIVLHGAMKRQNLELIDWIESILKNTKTN